MRTAATLSISRMSGKTALVLLFIAMGYRAGVSPQESAYGKSQAVSIALPDVPLPVFPNRDFNLQAFGAIGDGKVLDTDAIAKTIAACAEAGGGRVVIPAGIWLTGPIQLKSRVDLHLEKGALVVFSTDLRHYPLIDTIYEGERTYRRMSPIYGKDLIDIAITGNGIFDGSGHAWRPVKKGKMTEGQWKNLIAFGGAVDERGTTWYPSTAALNAESLLAELQKNNRIPRIEDYENMGESLRPVMVKLSGCRNVLLDGPTFQNSPAWNLHPLMCENITVRNLTVKNPWYSQNGDGLDLESCRNAVVHDCNFDVGDDAICMKSGKNESGRKRGMPTENIHIYSCVVYHGHGGFVIGSEMSGGVRNIDVHDCTFIGTDTGLRFKSTRGRGGAVENIRIRRILMKDIPTQAITFNMYYGGEAPVPEPEQETKATEMKMLSANEGTPRFRNIFIHDVICRGADQAVVLQGLPEMPIQDIELKNVSITAKTGFSCTDADRITLENVEIIQAKGPVMAFRDSRNVTIDRAACQPGAEVFLTLAGAKTGNIRLLRSDLKNAKKDVEFGNNVAPDVLRR